jgi:hypothetical protein
MRPAEEAWPPHGQESRRWAQTHRGGTRDDRTLRSIVVSLPPFIANRAVALDSETAADLESATSEIAKLDSSRADDLSALGTLLLRTESVASSKIEQIQANADDYARANSSAIAMAAATTALQAMIATVGPNPPIRLSAITSAHAALMHDDPLESAAAGELRTCRTGSVAATSPREAHFISRRRRKRCRATWTTSSPSPIAATCRHYCRPRSRMRNSSRSTPSQMATAASAAP